MCVGATSQQVSSPQFRHAPGIANIPNSPPSPPEVPLPTKLVSRPNPLKLNSNNNSTSGNPLDVLNFPSPFGSPFGSPKLEQENHLPWISTLFSEKRPSINSAATMVGYGGDPLRVKKMPNTTTTSPTTTLGDIDESFLAAINQNEIIESRRHRRRNLRSNTAAAIYYEDSHPAYASNLSSTASTALNTPVSKPPYDTGFVPTSRAFIQAQCPQSNVTSDTLDAQKQLLLSSSTTATSLPSIQKRHALSAASEAAVRSSIAAATRASAGCPSNESEENIPPVPPLPHFIKNSEHHDDSDSYTDCSPSTTSHKSENNRHPSIFSIRTNGRAVKYDMPALVVDTSPVATSCSECWESSSPMALSKSRTVYSPCSSDISTTLRDGQPSGDTTSVIARNGDGHIRRKIRDQLASSVAFDQLFDDPDFTINISLT